MGRREKGERSQGDVLKLLAHVPGQTGISTGLWKHPSGSLLDFPSAFRAQGWQN